MRRREGKGERRKWRGERGKRENEKEVNIYYLIYLAIYHRKYTGYFS